MSMEGFLERSDLHEMRREQERERRRIRDRQRRQSMSIEQKEKHLARRRRNYQLRRQRATNAQSDSQSEHSGIVAGQMIATHGHKAIISVSDDSVQCNGVANVGFDQGQEKVNSECTNFDGLEVLAYNSGKFPRRLRLNHIRHLARSLNHPLGELTGNNLQIVANIATEGNATTNCRSPKGLRLNSVKRLARAVDIAVRETTGQTTKVKQKIAGWREERGRAS